MRVLRVADYQLVLLETVRRDDLHGFLGAEAGVYVCNAPTEAWFERYGSAMRGPSTIHKKRAIFACMGAGSRWLSPTFVEGVTADTEDWEESGMVHLGYGRSRGRSAQIGQTVKIARWLRAHHSQFAYVLIYNLPLPVSLAPLIARIGTSLRLLVDYEDDYTLQRHSRIKNWSEAMLRRMVDGAICVNACMAESFPGRPTCVVNSLAEPTVFPSVRLFEGMRLLYSGTLDWIRGADLVPALVQALRGAVGSFSIRITGDGPLREAVESWTFPELKYLGVLSQQAYENEIQSADVCLVLQRPDHPFSRGSYPSKIQAYARYQKPVMVLRMLDGVSPW